MTISMSPQPPINPASGEMWTDGTGKVSVWTGARWEDIHATVSVSSAALGSPMTYVLMGEDFVTDNTQPLGDAAWDGAYWRVSEETFVAIKGRSVAMVRSTMDVLRQARREGRNVVTGVVSANTRRGGAPTPREPKANLDGLAQRCHDLMIQIATLSDDGPIPDGPLAELTKTYAALQAERDEAYAKFEEIDGNLSIGRAIIMEGVMG